MLFVSPVEVPLAGDTSLERAFFDRSAPDVAPELLGARFVTPEGIVLRITETEAYTEIDPASHSFRGPTKRNMTMFGPPGHLYVYFVYGMHWCANIATGAVGVGEAVLLRGGVVEAGMSLVRGRRGPRVRDADLANGPAKLCQALAITGDHDGVDLCTGRGYRVLGQEGTASYVTTARIGISVGRETPWRFLTT